MTHLKHRIKLILGALLGTFGSEMAQALYSGREPDWTHAVLFGIGIGLLLPFWQAFIAKRWGQ